jgi:hypothetical protein
LIDFGLARKYIDGQGNHLPEKNERVFKGNIVFASKHLFNMKTPSRRDDLMSLCYLMIYMITGDIPFIRDENQQPLPDHQAEQRREFERVKKLKNDLTPNQLCNLPESRLLLPFVEDVYSLKYDEEPDYSKLRFMLLKALLERDQVPT